MGFLAILGFWFVSLRPVWLGGSTEVLSVRGISMEPTYRAGDIVIAHARTVYRAGDIIAFRVPAGEIGAGAVVIHRIIGGDAVAGFVTQGDNNPDPDDWHPVPTDILGAARWRIPAVGRLLGLLHTVPGIAMVAGSVAALLVAFGFEDPKRRSPRRDRAATLVDPLDDLISLPPLRHPPCRGPVTGARIIDWDDELTSVDLDDLEPPSLYEDHVQKAWRASGAPARFRR